MVPSNDEGEGSSDQTPVKSKKGKAAASGTRTTINVEKDSEEYRKLRERNNEAVKKSRTRMRLRTQSTLDKVEKLRTENTKLEDRIDSLKKELDLLKELFVSHAGTKSLKRLTEVDIEVLLAESAPSSKKNKKGGAPYAGRSREVIEREVQALLGQNPGEDSDGHDEARPSTSREADEEEGNETERPESSEPSLSLENSTAIVQDVVEQHQTITETYTIVDGQTVWTTENGESVVVTIESSDGTTVVQQPDLHDIIEGEILMLE